MQPHVLSNPLTSLHTFKRFTKRASIFIIRHTSENLFENNSWEPLIQIYILLGSTFPRFWVFIDNFRKCLQSNRNWVKWRWVGKERGTRERKSTSLSGTLDIYHKLGNRKISLCLRGLWNKFLNDFQVNLRWKRKNFLQAISELAKVNNFFTCKTL